jgi:hypothetical protein
MKTAKSSSPFIELSFRYLGNRACSIRAWFIPNRHQLYGLLFSQKAGGLRSQYSWAEKPWQKMERRNRTLTGSHLRGCRSPCS